MAAAVITDGPDGTGYLGFLNLGEYSGKTQMGRAAFPTTDLTCTLKLKGGGMTGTPLIFITHSVVDKTVVASVSGDTVTFTRTENSSGAWFNYLIIFLK